MALKLAYGTTAVGLLFALAGPGVAYADNTTAASSRGLPMGTVAEDLVAASGVIWFDVRMVTSRSYAYVAWHPDQDLSARNFFMVDMFMDNGTTPATTQFGGDAEPMHPDFSDARRIIPSPVVNSGRYKLRVTNVDATNAHKVMVGIFETTLSSPWFFRNAASGYEAVPQARNHTNRSQTLNWTFYRLDGTVLCTRAEVLPANGGTTFGIGGQCATADAFGSVQLSHSAAPGGITANITTLSGASGLSFDSAFVPRHTFSGHGIIRP